MTIYIGNPGLIDLDTIRFMGVSVKSDTAIGYFGTGLKYALATLLRTGHDVLLRRGSERFHFHVRDVEIREQTFQAVYMNDERLAFTTELGKNWEVWQAFRELYSNMLDEGGSAGRKVDKSHDTVFEVRGAAFENCYDERRSIFVQGTPMFSVDGLEVYPEPSQYIFYRGVRAMRLQKPTLYTYNVTSKMTLTEDRTLKSAWDVNYHLSTRIPLVDDPNFHSSILRHDCYEQSIDMQYSSAPAAAFTQVCVANRSNATAPAYVHSVVEKHVQREAIYTHVDPTPQEVDTLREAFTVLENLQCDLDLYEVQLVEALGPSIIGLYHHARDQIYLARKALGQGSRLTAIVLYEEWLHKRHKLDDESRAMQTFLLTKIVSLAGAA